MLEELFTALKTHLTDQAKLVPTRLKWNLGDRHVRYWDPIAKEVIAEPIERDGNRHVIKSLESLIEYVNSTKRGDGRRIVWVGESSITCEMDEGDGLDIVTMPLVYSPLWLLLDKLRNNPVVSQADAIRYMRQHFSDASGALAALTAVRSLRLQRTEGFESEQTHDTSRIGKSVVQEAAGASQLPESITVSVPVFHSDHLHTFSVRVWLSIDFEGRKLLFDPDEIQFEKARTDSRLALVERLVNDMPEAAIYEGEYRVASQPIES
jgi:hypothetical protein